MPDDNSSLSSAIYTVIMRDAAEVQVNSHLAKSPDQVAEELLAGKYGPPRDEYMHAGPGFTYRRLTSPEDVLSHIIALGALSLEHVPERLREATAALLPTAIEEVARNYPNRNSKLPSTHQE